MNDWKILDSIYLCGFGGFGAVVVVVVTVVPMAPDLFVFPLSLEIR